MDKNNHNGRNINPEKLQILYQDGVRAAPFNIIIATLLIIILFNQKAIPVGIIWGWWGTITLVSLIRSIFLYWGSRIKIWENHQKLAFIYFATFTFVTGFIWGLGYFIFNPYLQPIGKTFYIILTFGGMASGALSSLAASYLSYYLYVFPMAGFVIFYHRLGEGISEIILSIIFTGYLLFLMLIHQQSHNLIVKNITLTLKQEELLEKIEATNKKLKVANEHLKFLSNIDGLTKVANRRYFKTTIKNNWARAKRDRSFMTVLLTDIDYFKEYNDHYGHIKGDECLKQIANLLKDNIKRTTDIVARYGGDEFIIMLNDTPLNEAIKIAQKILNDVRTKNIEHKASKKSDHVTLSIGAASMLPQVNDNFMILISKADEALYRAKKKGRDTISS